MHAALKMNEYFCALSNLIMQYSPYTNFRHYLSYPSLKQMQPSGTQSAAAYPHRVGSMACCMVQILLNYG